MFFQRERESARAVSVFTIGRIFNPIWLNLSMPFIRRRVFATFHLINCYGTRTSLALFFEKLFYWCNFSNSLMTKWYIFSSHLLLLATNWQASVMCAYVDVYHFVTRRFIWNGFIVFENWSLQSSWKTFLINLKLLWPTCRHRQIERRLFCEIEIITFQTEDKYTIPLEIYRIWYCFTPIKISYSNTAAP